MRVYSRILLTMVVPLIEACLAAQRRPPAQPDTSFNNAPNEAYGRAVALERETALRLVRLDRIVATRTADERDRQEILERKLAKASAATSSSEMKAGRALVPPDEELRLLESDVSMNRALEGLYEGAWKKGSGDDELRAALLHWTVLVRRALMREFHTRVPGLGGDPDCA